MSMKLMSIADGKKELSNLREIDSKTIGAIYDQYFSEVYRYVLYRVGDQTVAEDIASDVFIRLLEAVKDGRAPRRPEEEVTELLPDLKPGPASEVDQREQNRAVQSAYTQLTPEQQNVLALRFGQGYSLEETAEFMNKNVNAIKALQFRALAALQRELGEVDYE